ncbi:flagellar biosynthesis anti-sigma factor FlgM [Pontibacter sp. JAM-7]|uniref:flagellar biosynthesis anti-sigma factor FlgM n=1 Tax=Pontibacter sp. JAM-7 TaxID=3366581 RepID=UPI003AF6DA14
MSINLTGMTAAQLNSSRAQNNDNGQSKGVSVPGAETAPQGDTVMISDAAQSLKDIATSLAGAPEVDSDRVAAIQAALAEGSYSINADKIAEKMLQQDEAF